MFKGRIRVRPDALLHLRKHFYLEEIGFRSNGGVGVKVLVMFLLCGRIGHSFGHRREGGDPTQKASNMPEWNQAHRAHQQTEHGGRISNSIAHCVVRTMFQK